MIFVIPLAKISKKAGLIIPHFKKKVYIGQGNVSGLWVVEKGATTSYHKKYI